MALGRGSGRFQSQGTLTAGINWPAIFTLPFAPIGSSLMDFLGRENELNKINLLRLESMTRQLPGLRQEQMLRWSVCFGYSFLSLIQRLYLLRGRPWHSGALASASVNTHLITQLSPAEAAASVKAGCWATGSGGGEGRGGKQRSKAGGVSPRERRDGENPPRGW